jgi:predicted dehydrogenase
MAQVHAFIPSRIDPASGVRRGVGTPDSVQVLAVLEGGARAVYHLSGVTPLGQRMEIHLYGSEGVLHYDLLRDRLSGASRKRDQKELQEIAVPRELVREWRVEADFVDAIRQGTPTMLTDFETGVAYMEFTEAVARSARKGEAVELPLEEFIDDEGK